MAYFGRKPEKPGSVPGAGSGHAEQEQVARVQAVGRKVARGRVERPGRAGAKARTERKGR